MYMDLGILSVIVCNILNVSYTSVKLIHSQVCSILVFVMDLIKMWDMFVCVLHLLKSRRPIVRVHHILRQ